MESRETAIVLMRRENQKKIKKTTKLIVVFLFPTKFKKEPFLGYFDEVMRAARVIIPFFTAVKSKKFFAHS